MDLNQIREEIDQVDQQIVELFQRRMGLAGDVAASKRESGKPYMTGSGKSRSWSGWLRWLTVNSTGIVLKNYFCRLCLSAEDISILFWETGSRLSARSLQ